MASAPIDVPGGISAQLPAGYQVLASEPLPGGSGYQIVALASLGEQAALGKGDAPARPLMIFARRGRGYVLIGRNDEVVMRADDGGQCDPFLDNGATIATKGRFFTIENGVACGRHWTDYITFRLDERAGFVFDNERMESWSLNPSTAPDADALVRDGPQFVDRDPRGKVTPFAAWHRKK